MSFINNFFGADDDTDEESIDDSDALVESGIPRPDDDFAELLDDPQHEGKRETLVVGANDEAYAGKWPREMMENATANPTQPTWIGYEEARNPLEGVNEVGLLHEELNSHMAVFGASGFGKSTLLLNMMTQWAYAGFGFCFIDPKGDDSKKLMQMLPEHRLDDVYWMEPSSVQYDKTIGMNFLHTHADPGTPEFEGEVERVIDDLIPILRATSSGWGARMDSIIENITRRMLEDTNDYSLLDMYTLLGKEKYREELPEYYEEGHRLRPMAETIANYDHDDVSAILRRLQKFAESQPAREVVGHTESTLDAHEIINDNKIVILRTSQVGEDLQRLIATTVMRRLWSVIATRNKGAENDPYFLVADEFGAVAGAGNNVESMLSRGRSLGLSMTIASQQPSQLDDLQNSLGNVKNFISFSPGDQDDARFISTRIGMDSDMLMRLPQYNAYVNLSIGNEKKSGPVRTHTFAPYPPLRTEDEAEKVVADIVDKYGQEPIQDEPDELDNHPLEDTSTATRDGKEISTDDELFEVNDHGDTLTKQELLECIFDAQLQTGDGDPDSFTTTDAVEEQIALRLGREIDDNYGAKTSSALESLPDSLLDKDLDDDVYIKLAPSGRDLVFNVESGDSGSAGKMTHRVLLEKSYLMFRHLGYDVEIPRQEGRMPDGVCKPRPDVNPNTSETYKDAQRREQRLKSQYPRLYDLFGTDELHIEPENSTLTKPKQPFKNLIKAMEKGRKCVFVVKDGTSAGKDFAHNARKIHTWISKNKFARNVENGNRVFYNFNNKLQLGDGKIAAKPQDGEYSRWREDGDKIILESPEDVDEPYAEFTTVDHFKTPKQSDFPFYYRRDNSTQQTLLYNGSGKKLGTYQNKDGIKDDGFVPIRKPFIPELELPEWPLPDDWDDYAIVIIPSDRNDMSPHIYDVNDEYDEEYIPIFEDDEEIVTVNKIETDGDLSLIGGDDSTDDEIDDPDIPNDVGTVDDIDQAIVEETTDNPTLADKLTDKRSGSTDDDDDDEESSPNSENDASTDADSTKQSELPRGDDAPDNAENADEVPVADGEKPKSTTDVVKENDDTWTKPEPGDDDYDPSKDNQFFRTGYQAENSGDWTGGEARDEDSPEDMDEYWEEKQQNEQERIEQAKREALGKTTDDDSDESETDPDSDSDNDTEEQDSMEHDTEFQPASESPRSDEPSDSENEADGDQDGGKETGETKPENEDEDDEDPDDTEDDDDVDPWSGFDV